MRALAVVALMFLLTGGCHIHLITIEQPPEAKVKVLDLTDRIMSDANEEGGLQDN